MYWDEAEFYPEFFHDAIIYVCVIALICIFAASVSRWKEARRLEKEFAAYQQRRADEEAEGQ